MDIENLNIDKLPEDGVIHIYEGKALDEKEPVKLDNISGTIGSPLEFLSKHKTFKTVIIPQSRIEFDYEGYCIHLIINEKDQYNWRSIIGQMIETKVLKELKINTGEKWPCFALADFFRMNRTIFQSTDEATKLVTILNNFEATVNKDIEKRKDNKANYNLLKRQAVVSNLPDSFKLNLGIFKGQEKIQITVEIDIDPSSLECVLISPELADEIQNSVEQIIGEQLEEISKLYPELTIIEV